MPTRGPRGRGVGAARRRARAALRALPALLFLPGAGCGPAAGAGGPPPVLLVVADTLRADHLSFYGYARETSPAIDALARDALVFTGAVAQSPSTLPSVPQLMTGRYLPGTGARAGAPPALAEVLSAAGYATLAVVDNPLIETDRTRIERGFDAFYVNDVLDPQLVQQHWKTKTPADVITRQAIRALERRDPARPFFAWLHYFDPHDPYFPPFPQDIPFARSDGSSTWTGDIRATFLNRGRRQRGTFGPADRQRLIDLYDAEIRYLDRSLRDLFDWLRSEDLYDRTLIVLTSDHGEAFGEHGHYMHGRSLYDPEIRVPLMLKLPEPGTRHEVIASPAELVDLLPTLCALLEIACPEGTSGRDLLAAAPREYAFSLWQGWRSLRGARWKWIRSASGEELLFDLVQDPGETTNRAADAPEVLARMRRAEDRLSASLGAGADAEVREQVERLRDLGYVE